MENFTNDPNYRALIEGAEEAARLAAAAFPQANENLSTLEAPFVEAAPSPPDTMLVYVPQNDALQNSMLDSQAQPNYALAGTNATEEQQSVVSFLLFC